LVLVPTRGQFRLDQGHLPGALRLPRALIAERAAQLVPVSTPVVTYCWGPGCDRDLPLEPGVHRRGQRRWR